MWKLLVTFTISTHGLVASARWVLQSLNMMTDTNATPDVMHCTYMCARQIEAVLMQWLYCGV
jgi:hypothetical protein